MLEQINSTQFTSTTAAVWKQIQKSGMIITEDANRARPVLNYYQQRQHHGETKRMWGKLLQNLRGSSIVIIRKFEMSVRPDWAFFFESMYSHVYAVKWSLKGVALGSFWNFSKIFIFARLAAIFWSKLTPKWTFSRTLGAFCSSRVKVGF